MITEFRKSVNSVLYERVVSPLFGTFIFCWLFYNWEILYILFTPNHDKDTLSKIDFVKMEYFNWQNLFIVPAISSVIILIFYPLLAAGAYYLWALFQRGKIQIRTKVEGKRVLTKEQDLELRMMVLSYDTNMQKLFDQKDEIIQNLRTQVNTLNEQSADYLLQIENFKKEKITSKLNLEFQQFSDYEKYLKFKENKNAFNYFIEVTQKNGIDKEIFGGHTLKNDNKEAFEYLFANDIFIKIENQDNFRLTGRGQIFLKIYVNEKQNT